jgi:ATP-dependent RNA helicase DDX35
MIHKHEDDGDILIFQADRQAVELVTSVINNNRDKTLYAIPLWTGLSMNEQLKAIDRPPRGHRKVVVATSIAEASVTIDGIVFGISFLLSSSH